MMRAAFRRELIVALRRAGPPFVAGLLTVLVVLFVLVWRAGVPTLAPSTMYAQTVLVHRALLLLALPWFAHRSLTRSGSGNLACLGVLTALAPRTIVVARVLAIWLVLVCQISVSLPALVLAQQTGEVPWSAPVLDLIVAFAWAAPVAVSAVVSALVVDGPVVGWVVTTVATAVLAGVAMVASASAVQAAVAVTAAALVGGVSVALSSDRWTTWKGERRVA